MADAGLRIIPAGTITLLFTDIEGSTRMWERQPRAMQAVIARHDAILRAAIEEHGGYVFKTVGDAFCAAFTTPHSALSAALDAQRSLSTEVWPDDIGSLRVRMALHTGVTEERDGDYFGPPVNRVARLLSAGYGGQVLLSDPTYSLLRDSLPLGVQATNMGEHRLKDLYRPERIFQVVVAGGSWELPSAFPPLKTLDNRPNNLPAQPTPLVGREKEVAAVLKMLAREDVRLLTLTGPGGTGKTRLALQAAADATDSFEHGVFFVNLAPISEPNLVTSEIAQTLGIRESGQPLLQALKDYLHEKQMLLVLDNFEQVVDAAPQLADLTQIAPGLKALLTSRAPLHLRGEKEYPVPALELPAINAKQPLRLEQLTQYEAVRLFIARAVDARPDFEVSNETAPAVAEICVRLDGLPLAIELAAARIRALTPQAILSRLQSRLKVLTGGARDLPARQQTLRNTIEWSYDLLNQKEKKLFGRMSVFVGGRSLEATEAVCNFDDDLGIDVLDGVTSLIDQSLLRQEKGVGGEPRYVMLETIHEFAHQKLEEVSELALLRREHALYFMALAEEAEPQVRGPHQVEWLDRLEEEQDNFRGALTWVREESANDAPDPQPVDIGMRIVVALYRSWFHRGNYSEGRKQIRSILDLDAAKTGPASRRLARAWALLGEGQLAHRQDQHELNADVRDEALAIFRELDDKKGIASVALMWDSRKNIEEWKALLEESRTLFERIGDKWNLARVLYQLMQIAYRQGDYALSRQQLLEALALAEEVGDKAMIAMLLTDLGNNAVFRADYDSAAPYFERSQALSRQVGDRWGAAVAQHRIVELALLRGFPTGLRPLAEENLFVFRDVGAVSSCAQTLLLLGQIALSENATAKARDLLEESLRLIERSEPDQWVEATILRLLGHTAKREGDRQKASDLYKKSLMKGAQKGTLAQDWVNELIAGGLAALGVLEGETAQTVERTARLMGAAKALVEAHGHTLFYDERMEYESNLAEARARYSNEAPWQKAWDEGRAMNIEAAIQYALEEG